MLCPILVKMYKYLIYLLAVSLSLLAHPENIKLDSSDILSLPLPLPYDEKIVNTKQIDTFISASVKKGKQPVIVFGGNWCPDCRILEGTLEIQTIKNFMDNKYTIMHVDIGRYDKNMELMEHLNIERKKGVPRVVIFNLKKEILNSSTSSEWTSARDRRQQEIFDYFQMYADKN